MAVACAFTVPEVRRFFGFEKPSAPPKSVAQAETPPPQIVPNATTPERSKTAHNSKPASSTQIKQRGTNNGAAGIIDQSGNCNINQIGGSGNQATANCGAATWKLDDSHFDALASGFKRNARPSCVISAASDSDSQALARQLCNAARGGGPSDCIGPGLGNYISPLEEAATSGEVIGLACYADNPKNTSFVSIQESLSEVDLECEYKQATFTVHGVRFCAGGKGTVVVVGNMPAKKR
jgi:hypothetical protein